MLIAEPNETFCSLQSAYNPSRTTKPFDLGGLQTRGSRRFVGYYRGDLAMNGMEFPSSMSLQAAPAAASSPPHSSASSSGGDQAKEIMVANPFY